MLLFISAIKVFWRSLINSFWFLPGLISLLGPLLALLFLNLDHTISHTGIPFIFSGDSSDAISILSTIAGSLITVAGLTFSITIVVLQLVASQFTPRALNTFLNDRVTQVVAGGFIAIFAYSLLVLTAVHAPSPPDHGFVPVLSTTAAIGLGFLGLVLLLLFIHHTGEVIQVTHITGRLARQTLQVINQPYPGQVGKPLDEDGPTLVHSWYAEGTPARIYATTPGYIRSIALRNLIRHIRRPELHLHITVCPGDFVTQETVIAEVWPAREADIACVRAITHNIHIERERDIFQDPRFGIRQLADIALRALSPAVNDPTTGVICIKYLQAVFERLVGQVPQSGVYSFAHGTSTLVTRFPTFNEYMEVFVEIGRYATDNARVVDTLLTALTSISAVAKSVNLQQRLDILAKVASAIATPAITEAPTKLDDALIREHLKSVEHTINKKLQ